MDRNWSRFLIGAGTAATVFTSALLAPVPVLADNDGRVKAPNIHPREALDYELKRIDANTLRFTVENEGKTPINLNFRGATHEVVIKNERGHEVWRLSKESAHAMVERNVKLNGGARLTYEITLPKLSPGKYSATAVLLATNAPARFKSASTAFEVKGDDQKQKATTRLAVVSQNADGSKLLAVTLANPGQKPLKIDADKGVLAHLSLLDESDRPIWTDKVALNQTGRDAELSLAPGEERTWFVRLPQLTSGKTYVALAAVRGISKEPITRHSFVAGASENGLAYWLEQTGANRRSVRFQVVNNSSQVTTLNFATSQQFDLVLWRPDGTAAWRWSDGRSFSSVEQEKRLRPGDRLTFDADLPASLDLSQLTLSAYLGAKQTGENPLVAIPAKALISPLRFDLQVAQKASAHEAVFVVTNATSENQTLRFPSGQQYDFALKNSQGSVVWRWSADKLFMQRAQELRLTPGASLRFADLLPTDLPAGTYTLEAYLMADGYAGSPLSRREVTIAAPKAPIQFAFQAVAEQKSTKLSLAVTNTTQENQTLRFPTGQQYDFVVKDGRGNVVWRWSDGRFFTQRYQELRLTPGATMRFDELLPTDLPAGTYTAEAWLMAEGYATKAVSSRSVTVAGAPKPIQFALQTLYEQKNAKLAFNVSNTTQGDQILRFATGQKYDFVLKDGNGRTVWRWSDDQMFTQRYQELRLTPGASFRFEEAVPATVPAGKYTAEAYLMAEGYAGSVAARSEVTITSAIPANPAYQVQPSYKNGRVDAFQVKVTNPGRSRLSLKFPSDQHFEILLKNSAGKVVWRWSDGEIFDIAENSYDLEPGQSRTYTASASDAPRGSYTLELYLPAEASKPVLTQAVTLP